MRKQILVLALLLTTLFIHCKSNAEKEADAMEEVQEATRNLDTITSQIKQNAIDRASDVEWQTYKEEAYKTIAQNEIRIKALQMAINKPGKTFDATYKKSIDGLEKRNNILKTKISDYEKNQTNWDTFKREFDSDMTEIGKALKDLAINNVK